MMLKNAPCTSGEHDIYIYIYIYCSFQSVISEKNILKSLIIPLFLILVIFHQDPSLCPGLSSRPIWNSVQMRRHIKYKGLCKLNSLLFYNENECYHISLHHFKLDIPNQCYCKIKNLPPHI